MKKYDCIVIAGTTESREVIERQLKEKKKILACVATELGAQMLREYPIEIHIGRLDEEGFAEFFQKHPCEKIIDASHPFAKIVTETVKKVAGQRNIPYERFERDSIHYVYEKLHIVKDAEAAIQLLNTMKGNILLTTGVNTARLYAEKVKEAPKRVYIRVLNTPSSLKGCEEAGYPSSHVFGKMPPFTLEDNLELIRETNAKIMVSKDSGKTGGVDVKVEACKKAGIEFVLIQRPEEAGAKQE